MAMSRAPAAEQAAIGRRRRFRQLAAARSGLGAIEQPMLMSEDVGRHAGTPAANGTGAVPTRGLSADSDAAALRSDGEQAESSVPQGEQTVVGQRSPHCEEQAISTSEQWRGGRRQRV
ncbi:hypothetical protein PI125_g22377 [Phytophthora idaei]|nr:hypothetical protein PI125_g22377 [Phytophthora idaei]